MTTNEIVSYLIEQAHGRGSLPLSDVVTLIPKVPGDPRHHDGPHVDQAILTDVAIALYEAGVTIDLGLAEGEPLAAEVWAGFADLEVTSAYRRVAGDHAVFTREQEVAVFARYLWAKQKAEEIRATISSIDDERDRLRKELQRDMPGVTNVNAASHAVAVAIVDHHSRVDELAERDRDLERDTARLRDRLAAVMDTIQETKNLFLAHNLRAAIAAGTKAAGNRRTSDLADLIQEANIALIEGMDEFDPRQNTKFMTFIRERLINRPKTYANEQQRGAIRIPTSARRAIAILGRARDELTAQGIRPTADALAEYFVDHFDVPDDNDPFARAQRIQQMIARVRVIQRTETQALIDTLDREVGFEPGATTLGEVIADPNALLPEEHVEEGILSFELQEAAAQLLNRNEQFVISHRFGLWTDDVPWTLEQIGVAMQRTRERVRQIEKAALLKMRQHPGLAAFADRAIDLEEAA